MRLEADGLYGVKGDPWRDHRGGCGKKKKEE